MMQRMKAKKEVNSRLNINPKSGAKWIFLESHNLVHCQCNRKNPTFSLNLRTQRVYIICLVESSTHISGR